MVPRYRLHKEKCKQANSSICFVLNSDGNMLVLPESILELTESSTLITHHVFIFHRFFETVLWRYSKSVACTLALGLSTLLLTADVGWTALPLGPRTMSLYGKLQTKLSSSFGNRSAALYIGCTMGYSSTITSK